MQIQNDVQGATIFRKGRYKDERLLLLIEGKIVDVQFNFQNDNFKRNISLITFYLGLGKYGELSNLWIKSI